MSDRIYLALAWAFLLCVFGGTPASAVVTERNVYYSYDMMGRQLAAKFDSATGADGITNTYNGFGDQLTSQVSMAGFTATLSSAYDAAGRRTQVTHPDSQAFTYAYDNLSRLAGVYQGVGTGAPLDTFSYGANGLVASRAEAGGSSVAYGWDDIGRLTSQTDSFTGGTGNVGWTFGLNSASQIASESRTNDAYAWTGTVAVNRNYAVNGLNQYTAAGPASFTYDANGNLTGDGTNSYTYDTENRLVKAVGGGVTTNLTYDPLGRLFQVDRSTTATTTKFVYDGDALVLEFNGSNAIVNRYVHGSNAAADDPLIWYTGATVSSTTRRWLHADHLGSIVAATDGSGANPTIDSYDEYGIPQTDAATHTINQNSGRFQYTGQAWLPEIGMYYYKARIYSPTLGRFLQTDPVGYDDQINLYEYVGDDPVNATDPTGDSITEIGFLIYDVGQGISDVASGASAGELINDAVNIGLDVEPIPGLREVKGAVEVGRAVEKGVEAAKAERTAVREVGSYRHTFESGRTYDGKGTRSRAAQSAREVSARHNDPHVSTKFTPARNAREAFKRESRGIQERGGPKNDKNYNRIDSPGTKMRKQDGEP